MAKPPAKSRAACGVCGADIRPPFKPPPAETSPELDMRPGEPARSTLRRWVDTCPFCEASAPDLTKLTRTAKIVLGTPGYLGARGPRATLPFLRWAQLCPTQERAEALLWAAWVADDLKADEAAATFRRQSAACWPEPMSVGSALRLVDVLRRAGDFEGAAAQANGLAAVTLDETAARLLAYERKLLEARDRAGHLLASALPPPARTPHVAHKQAEKRGFWAWLKRG